MVIYQEQQKTYFILILVFIIVALMVLALSFFPLFFGLNGLSDISRVILTLVAVIDLVFFWCFRSLSIIADDQTLSFGFGFMKKRFFWHDLKSAQVEDFNLKNYSGYGIRFGKDKSIAFAAQGGRGVRLKTAGSPRFGAASKDYFFSSANPEKIAALINEKIKS